MCLQRYTSSALDKYCTNRGHEQVDLKNYNILYNCALKFNDKYNVIDRKIGDDFNLLVHCLLKSDGLYNIQEAGQCHQSMQEAFESTIPLKL